jgi:ABC-type multidrug transport system fused ATPase/permease subunit
MSAELPHLIGRGFSRIKNSPLARFLAFVEPHLKLASGAGAMGVAKFTLPLAFPLAFKYIIDVLVVREPRLEPINAFIDHWCIAIASAFGLGPSMISKLAVLAGLMTVLFMFQAAATYCAEYWSGIAGNRMILDLRCKMFRHLQTLSHSFFDRNPSGAVASRFITDVELAQNFVSTTLANVWMDGAALGAVIGVLFLLDHRLALISIGVTPFYVLLIRSFAPQIRCASRDVQHMLGEFSGDLQEQVAGMGIIKSYGREEYVASKFYGRTAALHERTIERVRLAARQQMYSEFLTRVAPLVVVATAALMIVRGGMELGTVVAFIGFLGYLYQPLERFSQLSAVVSASLAAIERIFEFLDSRPEVVERPGAPALEVDAGAVSFDKVSFGYTPRDGGKERTVLRGIDLRVEGGTTVALVGRSGAGKTTLASLLARFYDSTAGRVLIEGQDVRDVSLNSLRDKIGIVRQDTLLFSTSIRENLTFGKPGATEQEMWQALEDANIRSFVEQLPQRLDTVIGERGVKLSGGQRQRLALARAFLKNPPILILDEATSALDSESENLIRDAIRRLMSKRTSLMIAHRLAMAVNADLIVVLENGEIVETGTHQELLARGGVYATLFLEQTRGLVPQSLEVDLAGAERASDRAMRRANRGLVTNNGHNPGRLTVLKGGRAAVAD